MQFVKFKNKIKKKKEYMRVPVVRGLEQFWDKSVEEEERVFQVDQYID